MILRENLKTSPRLIGMHIALEPEGFIAMPTNLPVTNVKTTLRFLYFGGTKCRV